MLDPKLLRNEFERVAANLARRGMDLDPASYEQMEGRRKTLQVQAEELRQQRNTQSKAIGKAKAAGEDIAPLTAAVQSLGDELKAAEEALTGVQNQLDGLLLGLPNLLDESVPDGADESGNVEVRSWGDPPEFAFEARDHVDIGATLRNSLDTRDRRPVHRLVVDAHVRLRHRLLGRRRPRQRLR